MITTHALGFPRIGANRELKHALESYWSGKSSRENLLSLAAGLRTRHWRLQSALDLVPAGDFSLYDHVLDMSATLGNIPPRFASSSADPLDNYFRAARGRSVDGGDVPAGEMTKWFDTNYHYIVPEFTASTAFRLDPARYVEQIRRCRAAGIHRPKPVVLGPVTYLALGKSKDGSDPLALLPRLLPVYRELLQAIAAEGVEWAQIDEPVLVTSLGPAWHDAFRQAYAALSGSGVKLLLATYFGELAESLPLVCDLPVEGVHLDAVNARHEVEPLIAALPPDRIVSLGVVNGRNIWKTALEDVLDWLEPLARRLPDRLWIAPSCSLLHVPVTLEIETRMDREIRSWLAFATEKLTEIGILARALDEGRNAVRDELSANRAALHSRRTSPRVNDTAVLAAVAGIGPEMGRRHGSGPDRARRQQAILDLPLYPTTTIGSFPQTLEIREARSRFRSGKLDEAAYHQAMREEIARCIREQEGLDLDVFVHGEAERNDMVEYFGELLDGYVITENGWVQSYGSRCVKPPVLYGSIRRRQPMTVDWIRYAQSLTRKPVKGMLTGPVTILNWSFVRDDQPRRASCLQLALAIREEVLDLERAGVGIIQIDEAALREGLPLRRSQWNEYLDWAVESFRITANGVRDETQIHTHMCYSEFNGIIAAIAAMDADVITIETSRSDTELLAAFDSFDYPNAIGPGVYDIHSPNIPTEEWIVSLMSKAAARIPPGRLWVNPDCGLKTRRWEEVLPALRNMVAAARTLRQTSVPVRSAA